MENEIWKECPSYPGVLASNFGRIKLPESEAKMPRGNIRKYKTTPVFGSKTKSSKIATHQYFNVFSRKLGNLKVHQLVCEAFHGLKPHEKAVVIHIDENGLNNRADNLKWGTQKENLNMPKFIKYCESRTGKNSPRVKSLNKKQ